MNQKVATYDIAVLGSGVGGYPAAIRAAQQGAKVAIIEAKDLGGTCLNVGCIPSKTMIAAGAEYNKIKHASTFGITVENVTFDYSKMVDRKDRVVDTQRKGVEFLLNANGVKIYRGHGKFVSPNEIKVIGKDNAIIYAEKTIIATGSEPRVIPAFPCDGVTIHDSTSLLANRKLPKSILIVGGGVIGCEFASLFNNLGVEVTILELLPRILPTEALVLSEEMVRLFTKRGIKIFTNVQVDKVEKQGNQAVAILKDGKRYQAEMALISVGRTVNSANIGLESAGVLTNEKGAIQVNNRMETNVDGIYATGDVIGKWWLAHVATHQGIVAAMNATGHREEMKYDAIPSVTYTTPEAASVGLSVEAAKEKGYDVVTGVFPFQPLGKAQAMAETDGFGQIVVDRRTGQILGAQVIGSEADVLIAEMAVAIENELTIECITQTVHAHPTLSEVWLEAAYIASGNPLHLPPKKKKAEAYA
jgi:dihydrolipoamide dehydrogenase